MSTSNIITDQRNELSDALDKALDDDAMKTLKKAMDLVSLSWMRLTGRSKTILVESLSSHVASMADRAIEALLAGNERDDPLVEVRQADTTDALTATPVQILRLSVSIQSFTGCCTKNSHVALRRKIFEAHRDLVVNERIADPKTR